MRLSELVTYFFHWEWASGRRVALVGQMETELVTERMADVFANA
jgi:hypothetical protein